MTLKQVSQLLFVLTHFISSFLALAVIAIILLQLLLSVFAGQSEVDYYSPHLLSVPFTTLLDRRDYDSSPISLDLDIISVMICKNCLRDSFSPSNSPNSLFLSSLLFFLSSFFIFSSSQRTNPIFQRQVMQAFLNFCWKHSRVYECVYIAHFCVAAVYF